MSLSIDLSGKTAIVTGAGRGIGRAIALSLADAGADVVVAARSILQVEETYNMIVSKGRKSLFFAVDVADKNSVTAMVEETVNNLRGIHILVNNAGIVKRGPFMECSEEEWDSVVNTNLKGVFLCTQAVGKYMIEQNYGKVINIASTGGVMAGPDNAAYHASKAAVILLTKAVALEWIRYNINVNAIGPGFVSTELLKSRSEKSTQKLIKAIPMKRLANPEEIAPLAVFLASDLSNYMVGEHVIIDGGLICT